MQGVATVEACMPSFTTFMGQEGPALDRLLTSHYGPQLGADVAADTWTWAWEHWDEVQELHTPVAYLYRVAQSRARRYARWRRSYEFPEERSAGAAEDGIALDQALSRLPHRQRVAVLLFHTYGYSHAEAAALIGVSPAAFRNDLHRGVQRLRQLLGE